MKLIIRKKAFIDWYFDNDVCKEFFYDNDIRKELLKKGVFTISLQDILDKVGGYIPEDLIAKGQDVEIWNDDHVSVIGYDEIVFK
jgi:hypothetical protein